MNGLNAHLLDSGPVALSMRLLRTLIMGTTMLIPGLLLSFLIWYVAGEPTSEPIESLICNGIPLLSVTLGLVFGWMTGEAYSVQMELE
ncbi:MAG TPA: hypothetical protein D7H95_06485 [Candidatus Poseidoniales archaeon]|nr:MAG TPA: hypothetical protein D7H95_06485 [Candidatus Poseidoniales archaeon]